MPVGWLITEMHGQQNVKNYNYLMLYVVLFTLIMSSSVQFVLSHPQGHEIQGNV
jgi:hypothetical protein